MGGKTIHRINQEDKGSGMKRGEWVRVRENEMRWDCWDALALKKWVRMEDTGRVDDEGRAVCERVNPMEEFFGNAHHQIQRACT